MNTMLNELFSEIVQRGTPIVGQPAVETIRLVGHGKWHELDHSIKPRLFGEMYRLAVPVVENYAGDLYHDALTVSGMTERVAREGFDFYVRTHGTNLGPSARIMAEVERKTSGRLYNLRLHSDEREVWHVTITRLPHPGHVDPARPDNVWGA